jgi:hypothetical protein
MKNKNHSIEVTTTEEDNKYADYKYTNISMFGVMTMWVGRRDSKVEG